MHLTTLLTLTLLTLTINAEETITVSAPKVTSATYTDSSKFRTDMLEAHNFYRGVHNASELTWNETSAEFADDWAKGCEFEHSGGPTGENLAMGYANATANVDAWALERMEYSWKDPGFSEKTGHFTALVWKNTTSVGCGRRNCDGKNDLSGWLVVCEYFPPGNVMGVNGDTQFYKDNVLAQTEGKETDTVESGITSTKSAGNGLSELRWGPASFLAVFWVAFVL